MKSILIVDDEEIILDLLESLFGGQYTIFRAVDGQEALKIFNLESPNLVISDLSMPKLGGIELIKTLKSEGACKIIALSGQKESVLEEARKGGADEVLKKPIDMKQLIDLTGKYLVR